MDITRWLVRNQVDYIQLKMEKIYRISKTKQNKTNKQKKQKQKQTLGGYCGSDHESFIAKSRLKLKKVGKTTRPLRYDLYQIPYDYTAEVRNRFKGLI